MNSLEFIDKEIKRWEGVIKYQPSSENIQKDLNHKLQILYQIKTELEAWEVVKKNIVIDTTCSLYTIQIYKQDEECKTFEKALEIKDEKED